MSALKPSKSGLDVFTIDTPRSARGCGIPFTISARDAEEALDKVVAHMGNVWQRGEYVLRETKI